MNKVKLFFENILVYGFGGVISKIIPLIMVPVITRLMPNTDFFGISDLSAILVGFFSALACMGMYDAMYRLFFEKEDLIYKKSICSTALFFIIIVSTFVTVLMVLFQFQISKILFGNKKYNYLVLISALSVFIGSTNLIVSAPTRMQNKRKIFLCTNTLSSLLSYSVAIFLLLKGFYIIALPLATLISTFIIEFSFLIINIKWFSIKKINFSLLKQLIEIGLPLFPNFLIYWIFNSSDRIMITQLLDVGQAGIYSVGSKLGHISQLINTAFGGGWLFFAYSTMKEDNQVKNNSLIFEYLGIVSFICTIGICIISYYVYDILFPDQYLSGYIISPYLFLAPLLQMLYFVLENQFLVIKKSWPSMLILLFGAIFNLLLNFLLIPIIGIEGAAIATLAGYILSDIICIFVLRKMKLYILTRRFIIVVLIMLTFMFVWRFVYLQYFYISLFVAILAILGMILFYVNDLKIIFHIKP